MPPTKMAHMDLSTYRRDSEPAVMLNPDYDGAPPAHNDFLSSVFKKKPYSDRTRFYKIAPRRVRTMTSFELDGCTKSMKDREKEERPINTLKDWFAAYGTPVSVKKAAGGAMLRYVCSMTILFFRVLAAFPLCGLLFCHTCPL